MCVPDLLHHDGSDGLHPDGCLWRPLRHSSGPDDALQPPNQRPHLVALHADPGHPAACPVHDIAGVPSFGLRGSVQWNFFKAAVTGLTLIVLCQKMGWGGGGGGGAALTA